MSRPPDTPPGLRWRGRGGTGFGPGGVIGRFGRCGRWRRRGNDARPVERVGLLRRQREANGGPGVVGRRRGPVAEAQLTLGAPGRDIAPLEGISGLFGSDDPYAFGLVLGGLLVLGTVPRHGSSFQSPRSSCSLCSKAV